MEKLTHGFSRTNTAVEMSCIDRLSKVIGDRWFQAIFKDNRVAAGDSTDELGCCFTILEAHLYEVAKASSCGTIS